MALDPQSIRDRATEYVGRAGSDPVEAAAWLSEQAANDPGAAWLQQFIAAGREQAEEYLALHGEALGDAVGPLREVVGGLPVSTIENVASPGSTEPLDLGAIPLVTEPLDFEIYDGRYRVLRELGRGGFGRVLLVEDTLHDGQKLALKALLPHHQSQTGFEGRFRKEIQILRALNHKGIPQIFNDGKTEEGEFYFTMAFVEGQPFSTVLREEGAFQDESRVARILLKIVEVLVYAHERGVVHRDLKPDNVLLITNKDGEEEVRLLDFGIAKLTERQPEFEEVESMNTIGGIGTPHYMSPEQVSGKDIDGSTDVYALGVLLYQLLSGRFPFKGTTALEIAAARIQNKPEPLSAKVEPAWARKLVSELLSQDPGDRPTAKELQERLSAVVGGLPLPKGVKRATQKRKRAQARKVGAGAVALVAVGLIAWPFLTGPADDTGNAPNGGPSGGDSETPNTAGSGEEKPGQGDADGPQTGTEAQAPAPAVLVAWDSPRDGLLTNQASVQVAGRVSGVEGTLQVNGDPVEFDQVTGAFEHELLLAEGEHLLTVSIAGGDTLGTRSVRIDQTAPVASSLWADDQPIAEGAPVYRGSGSHSFYCTVEDDDPIDVKLDNLTATRGVDGRYHVRLRPGGGEQGAHTLTWSLTDAAENTRTFPIQVVVDTRRPNFQGLPDAGTDLRITDALWSGSFRVEDENLREVRVDGDPVDATAGAYPLEFALDVNEKRTVLVEAVDRADNRSEHQFTLHRIELAPPTIEEWGVEGLAVGESLVPYETEQVTIVGTASRDLEQLTVGETAATVTGARFELQLPVELGSNRLTANFTDTTGLEGVIELTVERALTRPAPVGTRIVHEIAGASGWPQRIEHEATGLELVLVAPGSATLPPDNAFVSIDGPYYLGLTEVPNNVFAPYAKSHNLDWQPEPAPAGGPAADPGSLPATNMTWDEARGFVQQAELRLPTLEQLRWAVHGPQPRNYPWGDELIESLVNDRAEGTDKAAGDGYPGLAPVLAFPAGAADCGALNLLGNAREWVRNGHAYGGDFNTPPQNLTRPPNVSGPKLNKRSSLGFRVCLELP